MPTTYANSIDNNPIYAARAEADQNGLNIDQYYAKKSELADKQDTISDLSTIRSGAAAGATAVQPGDLATVATTGDYDDLIDKPTIPSGVQLVPAATSADADKVLTVDSLGVPGWAVVPSQPTGLFEAVYGQTTYADIAQAITDKRIVYCRVETSSTQARMAFLAYKGNGQAEFQYLRSNSSSSGTDSVFVYQVNSSGWTTTERPVKAGNISYPVTQVNVNGSSAMTGTVANITIPAAPTVDQTYDSTSTNAQSGTAVAEAVSTKQDTISDLATIRSGAAAGATAVQPSDLATVATTGDYDDLTDKPDLSVYATGSELTAGLATKQDTISDLATIRSGAAAGATAVQPGDLATVATTGAYSDLTGTPTIPTATSDLTNDSGFITLSDVPAQVNADWNSSSGASEIFNKPTIPSGAQLVPAATIADADKVLTVDSQGTPAWASAQAPISAGTGIDITNNVVSVDTSVVATQTDLADKEDAFDVGTGLEMDTSGATPTLQVEAPVDIVAGPGIVIDNPDGNTLRVSTDENYETVLWEGTAASVDTAKSGLTLTESPFNFEYVEVHWVPWSYNDAGSYKQEAVVRVHLTSSFPRIGLINEWTDESNAAMFLFSVNGYFTSTKFYTTHVKWFQIGAWTVNNTGTGQYITRIVGIHRIANN